MPNYDLNEMLDLFDLLVREQISDIGLTVLKLWLLKDTQQHHCTCTRSCDIYINVWCMVPPAAPVVIVTPETVAIIPVAATMDASGHPVVASPSSIPISFQILPEQQVNGPVDK